MRTTRILALILLVNFAICGRSSAAPLDGDRETLTRSLTASDDNPSEQVGTPSTKAVSPLIKPTVKVPITSAPSNTRGVDWTSVLTQSLEFLTVEQGFRWVTEYGARHSHRSFFGGYVDSLNSLHGWADGDPFYVNYVGHPMQGSIAGFIFAQNDRKYRTVEFGKNREYWKGRLRAAAFAWAYSEQFEIGPVSEATIGATQAFFPQQGFVDHVATPTVGLGWMIAEDFMDKYVIQRIEAHTNNRLSRLLVRSGLNPSRSMANMVAGRPPWHRDTRPGVSEHWLNPIPSPVDPKRSQTFPAVAPFEFLLTARGQAYLGTHTQGACIGGGGTAAYRVAQNWQIVGDVSGCKFTDLGAKLSGDSLSYMLGPRWTATPLKSWEPYLQVLVGGKTLTHELIDPAKKAELQAIAARQGKTLDFPDHAHYTQDSEVTGLAAYVEAGVDAKLSSAIAIRVASLGYMHSWHSRLDGINYSDSLQFTGGLIVRFGTW